MHKRKHLRCHLRSRSNHTVLRRHHPTRSPGLCRLPTLSNKRLRRKCQRMLNHKRRNRQRMLSHKRLRRNRLRMLSHKRRNRQLMLSRKHRFQPRMHPPLR